MNSPRFDLIKIWTLTMAVSLGSCSDEIFTPPEVDKEQISAACSLPPSVGRCPIEPEISFDNGCSPFWGSADAPEMEVVSFSNFDCPYCAMFAATVRDIFSRRRDLEEKVRVYFHHYPFNIESDWNLHAAAHAAKLQGDEFFWAVHDEIYERASDGEHVDAGDVVAFARDELSLDMTRFDDDRKSDQTMSFIAWDRDQAVSIGVAGTPTVFVCGEPIDWRFLEYVLDGLLGTAPTSD